MQEAAAAAPAPEVVSEAPEVTEDAALDAVWDELNAEEAEKPEPEDQADEPPEDVDGEDDTAEEPEDDTPAPTELPKAIRDKWKDIPEDAREAIVASQRDLNRKLAEQGRMVQGIAPIRDALVQAAKDLPALANMTPAQIARDVTQLAKISADFNTRPLETMVGLIKQHGLEAPLRKMFTGQQPQQGDMATNELRQHIAKLERQLETSANPDYIRTQVDEALAFTTTAREVTDFAGQAEHWADVEPHLPSIIPFVQQMLPDASPQDVLRRSYEMAVSQIVPEAKAKASKAVEQTAEAPDPAKLKAAQKAKSVNVRSTGSGKSRTLSEDELLDAAWARAQQA